MFNSLWVKFNNLCCLVYAKYTWYMSIIKMK